MQEQDIGPRLLAVRDRLVANFDAIDPSLPWKRDSWLREEGGGGETAAAHDGSVIEKVGVAFSQIEGEQLPAAATAQRPQLAGRPYAVAGVSVVVHPRNPYVPTSHLNVRFFRTTDSDPIWWCGGGFDLTPYYAFEEDARLWHRHAQAACARFDPDVYPRFKQWCDDYFYLPHRDEHRGIGGIFFDDFNDWGPERSLDFLDAVADEYAAAYRKIADRRKDTAYGDRERRFQSLRRGRYVEFNLVYDRGTLFGLQAGGRTESILMSLPPVVHWAYGYTAEAGSEESKLLSILRPRDWLADEEVPRG